MIVYASRTGNVKYIVSKLNLPSIEIEDNLVVDEEYFIFTYTDGLGQVPNKVSEFLQRNHTLCKGVIASGNTNFGYENFCTCADKISEMYGVPIIRKIELRGFEHDYNSIVEQYNNIMKG